MPTTDIAALMSKGIEEHHGYEVKMLTKVYPRIFNVDNTKARIIDHQGWIPYGLPVQREPGSNVTFDQLRQNFGKRYIVVGYSTGDVLAEEDLMDDQYGMLVRWASAKGGAIARSFVTLEERVAADYMGNIGFTATSPAPLSPDGDALFSTTHPTSAADTTNTLSNRPSTDVDLSMAALQAARANIEQQMSSNGVTIAQGRLTRLVVNPNKAEIAYQLARGQWTPDTADLNMNTLQGKFEVISWAYFRRTGATAAANSWNAWFVLGEAPQLNWLDREQVAFDNDKDVQTRSQIFTAHRRFVAGHDDWRDTYGSPGV